VIATVLDTGPIVAALNSADRWHSDCARLLTEMAGRKLLPSPVLTEVCWLLERWPKVEAAFLRSRSGSGPSGWRRWIGGTSGRSGRRMSVL
jgi:predicted nucleic acid-binding protein